MPGSWYHEDLPYRPRLRAETGFVKNYTGELGPVERGPGSLTEYLEGLNLDEFLQKFGPLPEARMSYPLAAARSSCQATRKMICRSGSQMRAMIF